MFGLGSSIQQRWFGEVVAYLGSKTALRTARLAILFCSLLMSIWLLSTSAWYLLPGPSVPAELMFAPTVDTAEEFVKPQVATVGLAQLVEWNLFGHVPPPQRSAQEQQNENKIDATLMGVIYSSNPKMGRAMIRVNRKKQKTKQKNYRIGDTITGTKAVVNNIGVDHVVLLAGGELQILPLYEKKKKEGASDKAGDDINTEQETLIDKRSDSEARAVARKYREHIVQDVTQLGKLLRFSPVKDGERTTGYRVDARINHREFAQLGFKGGDIITSVEGVPLDGFTNLQKALLVLERGGIISIRMLRKNVPLELILDTT